MVHREPLFLGPDRLPALSADRELVACFVDTHVMYSAASAWTRGQEVWSAIHDSDQGIRHLEVTGELPPSYDRYPKQAENDQDAEDTDDESCVDHFFDVPVKLARDLTGFRFDEGIPGGGEAPFEELASQELAALIHAREDRTRRRAVRDSPAPLKKIGVQARACPECGWLNELGTWNCFGVFDCEYRFEEFSDALG